MIEYLVKEPTQITTKTKAILMLHGFGSNEADLFSLSNYFPNDLYIISARAPYKLDFGGYAWYDIQLDMYGNKISNNQQAEKSLHQLSEFIDIIIEKYNISPENFNLMGFSQGAILSYALSFNYPNKVKNIIGLSGYINEDIMPLNYKNENFKHLNFFVSHGLYDEIIPIELARKIPEFLQQRKVLYEYNEYPMGHEINAQCLQDMLDWINKNF